ncbi:MAG: PIG-L family deacetylase [Acidobacteriaceae bacterium]|nr:PIG-L family deacetylase [Acidobacteriaceae bacterium]
MTITRRKIWTSAAAAPLLTSAMAGRSAPQRQKIVVTGGHPGDPECGCAGTIARYTALGNDAVLLYMNRGEGFCSEADLSRCASIRTAEAMRACEILKARAAFAGQYDGRAIVDNSHYEEFAKILAAEKPDVVFTHWPVDAHRDHRAISMLVFDAWLRWASSSRCTITKSRAIHRCSMPRSMSISPA